MSFDFLGNSVPRIAAPFFRSVKWRGALQQSSGETSIYLTFDDGPDPESTPRLLATLKDRNLRATFFLLGERAEQNPDLVKSIVADGHQIGSHGWDHKSPWRGTSTTALAGLERTAEVLERLSGSPIRFVRPPYGRFTPSILRWSRDHRQELVLWDVMPGDFRDEPIAQTCGRLTKRIRPGSIIVLHDSPGTIDKMPVLLTTLESILDSKGWASGHLSLERDHD